MSFHCNGMLSVTSLRFSPVFTKELTRSAVILLFFINAFSKANLWCHMYSKLKKETCAS